MKRTSVRKYTLVASAFVSLVALMLSILGGGMVAVLGDLFKVLGFGSGLREGMLDSSPLGFFGAVTCFAAGIALSFAGMKWPVPAGVAMLLLAVIAFLFGGPISKSFGVAIFCAGAAVLATSAQQKKDSAG